MELVLVQWIHQGSDVSQDPPRQPVHVQVGSRVFVLVSIHMCTSKNTKVNVLVLVSMHTCTSKNTKVYTAVPLSRSHSLSLSRSPIYTCTLGSRVVTIGLEDVGIGRAAVVHPVALSSPADPRKWRRLGCRRRA
jgi:hypothetical protein